MLHPDPFHVQRYTKILKQRDGERFTNQMESKTKSINKKELQFSHLIKQISKQQRYSGKRINATIRANDPNTQIHKTHKEI